MQEQLMDYKIYEHETFFIGFLWTRILIFMGIFSYSKYQIKVKHEIFCSMHETIYKNVLH